MILKNAGFLKSAILLPFWLFGNNAYTQTEMRESPNWMKSDTLKKYNLLQTIPDFESNSFNYQRVFSLPHLFMEKAKFLKPLKKQGYPDWLSFRQIKTELEYAGLGGYQYFNNRLIIKKNKFALKIESGLANQNTLLMTAPMYQLSFGTQIKYQLTDWLDAYLYGQYVTKPLNRPKGFFDPFLYSNPLFLQTEVGGGLRTNFKRVNADLKVFSIYREESQTFSPMNSVLKIEF